MVYRVIGEVFYFYLINSRLDLLLQRLIDLVGMQCKCDWRRGEGKRAITPVVCPEQATK
jgi:hypothetical protein